MHTTVSEVLKTCFFFLFCILVDMPMGRGGAAAPHPRILPGYAIGCRPVLASNTKLVNAVTSIIYHIAHFTMYIPNNCLVSWEFYKKLIIFHTSYWVLLRKAFFTQSF